MQRIHSPLIMQQKSRELDRMDQSLALVPTMGALHRGHLSLVEKARSLADVVVVSLFVNPTQFGPNEDYARYPRQQEQDIALLTECGADYVYLPEMEDMYPQGFATSIHVSGVSEGLCGEIRPGHFDGVATVVNKLLMQTQPNVAVFGEKDFQQLHVIRQMVQDLNIPTQIIGAPILREADGLAMSSRNAYLSEESRSRAAAIYRVMNLAKEGIENGDVIADKLQWIEHQLLDAGFASVDYVACRDEETLAEIDQLETSARLLVAARIGETRLIDNISIGRSQSE